MTKRKRSGKKPTAVRRREFIKAASQIISEEGLSKFTTRAVANRVGVAQPTLFIHFRNKPELIEAIVDEAQKQLKTGLDELDLAELAPEKAMHELIIFHFSFVQSHPVLPRILFSEELQTGDPALKNRMETFVEFYLGFVTDIIASGYKSGVFSQSLPARQQARIIICLFQGLAYRWILDGFSADLTKYAEPVANQLLHGLMEQ